MQWKRSMYLTSLLSMLALVLAACGVSTETQGGAGTSATANASASAASAAGAPDGTKTTIRWRTRPSDAAEQAVYQSLAQSATEALSSQGITVQYDPGVNQGYFEKLKTELAAGTAPDIFWIGAVELADFVNTGQILDLKPLIDKDQEFKLDQFNALTIKELSRDGKVYGLPRDISTMVTYYNADLFQAAGLATPKELAEQGKWNWDTFLESAQKLTDANKQQYGVGFGNWWGPGWGYFTNAAGGSIFNEDRTACALDQPKAIEGAKFAKQLYEKQLLPASDAESENLFNAGKIGMYFNGRWFTPGVRTNAKFNWDVAEMPQGEVKSTWLFWGPYLINAKTANSEAAWAVLKQITSAESLGKVAEMGTNIPSRTDDAAINAFLKSTPPQNNQAFITGTEYAVAEAPVWQGSWADFSSTVQKQWDQMIAGQLTPEEFGKTACEQTVATFTQ